jgi:hypothetical protein
MNQNESEFEQQLRLIVRPRQPSAALDERIADALAQQELTVMERIPTAAILPRSREASTGAFARWWQGLGWALAGAAVAGLAVMAFDRSEAGKSSPEIAVAETTAAADDFEHTEETQEVLATEDEGLVISDDDEPVRQVRYRSVERHVWTNPKTGARMEFEVPREDVRFMPVAMQ